MRSTTYEYERQGVCNIFLACEPLAGRRQVKMTQRRTKGDWAKFVRELVEVHDLQADRIVLAMESLSTHTPTSFYEVFAPEEARRLCKKLEILILPSTAVG
jgi:hypothetical protein